MSRGVIGTAASLLLALLLGPMSGLPAQAQNLCTTQASVRNPLAVEAPGVWKTLLGWLGVRPSEDKGGVGGTGISEGGIGGTGIVGVVTGFASICVNGVEVQFDADTPISDNGQPGSARQLAVGQMVAVQASGAAEALSARHIALIHAAVGPIETLNVATGEFRILGQTARALDPGALAQLKAGNWVRVSGHRLAQGEIAASRIEPIAAQAQAQLNGSVSQVDGVNLTVDGTRIRFDALTMPAGVVAGREVRVSGQWDGRSLQAQHVQVDPTRKELGAVEQVVLEGYIYSLGGGEISLGRGPLTLGSEVRIVGGSTNQLAVNQRVKVSGRVGADQRVSAERVEFRGGSFGSDGGRRSDSKKGSGGSDDGSSSSGKGSSGGSESSDDSDSSGSSGGSGSDGGHK